MQLSASLDWVLNCNSIKYNDDKVKLRELPSTVLLLQLNEAKNTITIRALHFFVIRINRIIDVFNITPKQQT